MCLRWAGCSGVSRAGSEEEREISSVLATDPPSTVAVVGAGLSGLACARRLVDRGCSVQVFDKGRGVGGRMATRRADDWQFDHGAQYFTARDARFQRLVKLGLREGFVALWEGDIAVLGEGGARLEDSHVDRFVGVPAMNAVCRLLASNLEVVARTRVAALERVDGRWHLASDQHAKLGSYDAVVVSAPAPQTAILLEDPAPEMAARAARAGMAPCWAAMASFAGAVELGFDAAFVEGSALSWVARNNSKPGRSGAEAWVLHASPDWSREHLELEKQHAARVLLDAFRAAVGGLGREPTQLEAHRWRFALPTEPLPEPFLFDADLQLGACGDWCGGPRVEGAFLSGRALADRLLS